MGAVMSRSSIFLFALLTLGVVLPGCFRETIRDTDYLTGSKSEKIHVTTKDGSRYWFSAGEYSIVTDSTGAKVLIGTGKRDRGDTRSTEAFKGSVPFASIDMVAVSESNPWGYFMLGILTGFALVGVAILVSFSGFRVG
jgi:hypothetical protein